MIFPPDFTHPDDKRDVAELAAKCIAGLSANRRAVVQAGGCSGLWPLALSTAFNRVYTCEPHPVNFQYLEKNVATVPTITAFPYAVGDREALVGLTRSRAQAGLWRVDGDGEIPMRPIDDLVGDAPIDALVLDVEGGELAALRGAERVIDSHHPLLWFEFLHDTDAITDFLIAHGYARPARGIGADWYSVHTSRGTH